jgi:hypothetical protein
MEANRSVLADRRRLQILGRFEDRQVFYFDHSSILQRPRQGLREADVPVLGVLIAAVQDDLWQNWRSSYVG